MDLILGYIIVFIGIIAIAYVIICAFNNIYNANCHGEYIILTTLNNEADIEGVILSLINNCRKKVSAIQIIIIDKGSSDDTIKILDRLSENYDFIHILNTNNYQQELLKIISID